MFTQTQQISVALAAVACSLYLDEAIGISSSDSVMCRAVRSSGRALLRVTDGVRGRWDTYQERREQAKREEWGRVHTRPARIYTP